MVSPSSSLAAQKRDRILATTKDVPAISTVTSQCRTDTRLQSEYLIRQENSSDSERSHSPAGRTRKRSRDPNSYTLTERSRKRVHAPNIILPEEEDAYRSRVSSPSSNKLEQIHAAPTHKTIKEARIEFWIEQGTWPTAEQETSMDPYRELLDDARATKRSLSRKRSNASLHSESTQTPTSTSQQPRDQKSVPYKHPLFEEQLRDCGSFMDDHMEGITAESEELCRLLLTRTHAPPEHTLFSNDDLFNKTCKRIRGENEAKVVRDISPLITPSAEILADSGVEHLKIVRETVNACWVLAATFMRSPGSRLGPRPQPDFSLGFRRDAFSREQLQKLQPFLGNLLTDSSFLAAIYNMYLPFFSAEVKCGAAALDVADRQNAYTQSVVLRGLYKLFRLIGREKELHREINGFSISHNDVEVRIWGHYAVIDGDDVQYYRHPIHGFNFTASNGRDRWAAYNFVRNLYDVWVVKHFERICNVIDQLPADLNFDVSEPDVE